MGFWAILTLRYIKDPVLKLLRVETAKPYVDKTPLFSEFANLRLQGTRGVQVKCRVWGFGGFRVEMG